MPFFLHLELRSTISGDRNQYCGQPWLSERELRVVMVIRILTARPLGRVRPSVAQRLRPLLGSQEK
jgi:hypothetical protein